MSKLIAELLGTDRNAFDKIIQRLENITLQPGVDVGLTAEIITKSRQKARELGYEPSETTARELYYGLLAAAEYHDSLLRNKLKIKSDAKFAVAAEQIAKESEKLLSKEKVIALQPAGIKRVLKAVPPKKTLKLLKFRSLDSVIKRENPVTLYAFAKMIEDKSWHSQVAAKLKRLQSRDAIEQPVKVVSLPKAWVDKLKKHPFDNVVQPVAEVGAVLLLPTIPVMQKGSVLLTTSLVLQAGQRLAIESLPYKTKALSSGMEKLMPEIAAGYIEQFKPIHGLQPSWSAVYQLLVDKGKRHLPDYELILGDLSWETTEIKLASIVPEMDFWVDSHYLGYKHEPFPVSMHVIDCTASLVLERNFGEQIVSHFRASLWNELQVRYLKQDSIESAIINQLSYAQGIVL